MNFIFRADASFNIGSGHIMRCLTLADALTERDHHCSFICRPHKGHLGELIQKKGYSLHWLKNNDQDNEQPLEQVPLPEHYHWLETSWQSDAEETRQYLSKQRADWLIIDHYALDYRWQQVCQSEYGHLMVIDDLADRKHLCNILLDQTFNRHTSEYKNIVPDSCQILTGAEYSLLRPEFSQWRSRSLSRRNQPTIQNILINLGGVDKDNLTADILNILNTAPLPESCKITVVMGNTAPHASGIKQLAKQLRIHCQILQGISNMAELMAEADIAIGAAGSTSWERCCLGLPTLMVILADNQRMIAAQLEQAGAAIAVEPSQNLDQDIKNWLNTLTPDTLLSASAAASRITDGTGITKVTGYLEAKYD